MAEFEDANLDIDEGKIQFEDGWHSVEDLKAKIKESIDSGNYDVAEIATALKSLESVVEQTQEVQFKLLEDTAEKLQKVAEKRSVSIGAVIRDALASYLGGETTPPQPLEEEPPKPPESEPEPEPEHEAGVGSEAESETEPEAGPGEEPPKPAEEPKPKPVVKPTRVQCHRCKAQITITTPERPITITCPQCGERGRLT